MSMHIPIFSCLERSTNSIFFEKPINVNINEKSVTRYAKSQKIETLINELQEKGPLIGLGQIGPNSYAVKPFELKNKLYGQNIYGWEPGAKRVDHSKQNYIMILGAKKIEDREYVYFTSSEDVTANVTGYLRKHQPSSSDAKIYVVSHKTFQNYLCDLYPLFKS
jgi:hypothetical protein